MSDWAFVIVALAMVLGPLALLGLLIWRVMR